MKCPFCGRANVIEVMTRFERGPGNATVQAVRYCDNCGTVFGEEKRHIDAILAERDGYRAVAEQRAQEVERLRRALAERRNQIVAEKRRNRELYRLYSDVLAKLVPYQLAEKDAARAAPTPPSCAGEVEK